jgi:hypothetical protein
LCFHFSIFPYFFKFPENSIMKLHMCALNVHNLIDGYTDNSSFNPENNKMQTKKELDIQNLIINIFWIKSFGK